jgi:hypothetical protein
MSSHVLSSPTQAAHPAAPSPPSRHPGQGRHHASGGVSAAIPAAPPLPSSWAGRDLRALFGERPGGVTLPRVTLVGQDEFGDVFRVYASSAWPGLWPEDMDALLELARGRPTRRREVFRGRGGLRRARELLGEMARYEREQALKTRRRLASGRRAC